MIDINISKVTKSYGFSNILNNISLEINKGDRVSIVGDNGSGKSTLLKILAKEETVSSGTIAIRSGATIGMLHQIPDIEESIKVLDILYRSVKEILDIEEKLKRYENKMQELNGNELNKI
jgi:ATPase subunit of ABC transporter with duplicated ATPase domains